jgi:cytochrome c553
MNEPMKPTQNALMVARMTTATDPGLPDRIDRPSSLRRIRPTAPAAALALLLALSAGCLAQDAARGRRLFTETGKTLGKDVASCAGCHADVSSLRKMIANRGGRTDDAPALARWLGDVMDGAHPPARNAMAQFREVLHERDLADLAAYLSSVQSAGGAGGTIVAAARARAALPALPGAPPQR